MTRTLSTIETGKQVFEAVDLAARLRRGEGLIYASVNGHAQAAIVRSPAEFNVPSSGKRQQT